MYQAPNVKQINQCTTYILRDSFASMKLPWYLQEKDIRLMARLCSLVPFCLALIRRHRVHGSFFPVARRRHSLSFELFSKKNYSPLHSATRYTLNEENAPPTPPHVLREVVHHHARNYDQYLTQRPLAKHTVAAFSQVQDIILRGRTTTTNRNKSCRIVLDSGCGTGRSTRLLERVWDADVDYVIGIDRSWTRLQRNLNTSSGDLLDDQDSHEEPLVVQESEKVILVRAELVDFWRLLHQQTKEWNILHHYMLYPNPYPKASRIKSRWYAHPSFPLLMTDLGIPEMTIRSNWKGYLQEFADSVQHLQEYYKANGQERINWRKAEPISRVVPADSSYREEVPDDSVPIKVQSGGGWTNFEQNYHDIGEPTYELKLVRD